VVKMKRKVVQIAGFTKVISLPSEWVKKHKINKGEELEIHEEGNNLVISPEDSQHKERATIDLTKTDRFLRRFIDIYYRLGYDELEVRFSDNYTISQIQEEVSKRLLGFEIVEQKDNYCRIRSISRGAEEEFDIIVRRIFLMLMSMSKEGLEIIRKKEHGKLNSLIALEEVNNKFTNFCQRTLNKHGYLDDKKTTILYYTITQLETIADAFANIFRMLQRSRAKEIDPQAIELYRTVDSMINDMHTLFYGFKLDRLLEFDRKWKEVISKDEQWFKKGKSMEDNFIMHQLHSVAAKLHHLSEMVY
jgi:bifunctional DNA-binding transcriptional regulator/antitoxin component of YhaV-PrlF toxin-antitoxin module